MREDFIGNFELVPRCPIRLAANPQHSSQNLGVLAELGAKRIARTVHDFLIVNMWSVARDAWLILPETR